MPKQVSAGIKSVETLFDTGDQIWDQRPRDSALSRRGAALSARTSMARSVLALCVCCAVLLPACAGLDNGLARRPFMGFNTWQYWMCDINQTIIRESIDALVQLGLQKMGYEYMNIDGEAKGPPDLLAPTSMQAAPGA